MSNIGKLLSAILDGMKIDFVLYGYEISFWQIFLFTTVGSIIVALIGGFFGGK